jgi:hypothetical protein
MSEPFTHSEKLDGRDVTVHPPIIPVSHMKRGKPKFQGKPHSRYVVNGINHPKGKPIRFHSFERAENYLRNKGLL